MATLAARRRPPLPPEPGGVSLALARRVFWDARVRTLAFAYAFAIYAYLQPSGFRGAYPTLADRIAFAHSFAGNPAIRLFYGYPYDPVTIGGYSAWRVGGTLAIVAAVFGVLAGVRALRADEDAGRMELVLAGRVARRQVFGSAMTAIAGGIAILWLAAAVGYVAGGLPAGGSLYLSLATASVALVFAAVGAVVSQLAPTRRLALQLGTGVLAACLLVPVVAETVSGAGWLRWLSPLGWAEELRPFTGARPLVLLLAVAAAGLLLVLAAGLARARDIGTGIFSTRDQGPPRLGLLSTPTAQALRLERGGLILWLGCFATFAVILGMIAPSVSTAGITPAIRRELAKLGSGSILSPTGYLAFVFIFFILAVSLFGCAQLAAARREEADQRLEPLLAQPVGRVRWLGGRLGLAAAGALALALTAGLVSWAGASAEGVSLPLGRMLEAGANCLPSGLLFLGLGALAYAIVPRASTGIAYGLVSAAFAWYLVGALAGVPRWLVEATPFAHIGFVPGQPFRTVAALVMVAIGGLAIAVALGIFRRRDLVSA